MSRIKSSIALLLVVISSTAGWARDDLSEGLRERLDQRKGVPGIVALRIEDGKITAGGAAGVRKAGDQAGVELGDKFHLGSCTKAMTATLAAVCVEKGLIKWDSTIGDSFKENWIHAGYRPVTLAQLLSNTGGCPGSPPQDLWRELFTSKAKPTSQRLKLAKGVLSEKPAHEPGEHFEYSNTGYAIAGMMLERAADKPWEELIEEELFKPLKMESAGFRAPASGRRKVDQPWGHQAGKPVPPKPYGDNPDAVGPAGTVHCSIEDWAKFALLHLEAKPGGLLKKKESFEMMHKVHDKKSRYCLGWGKSGKALAHDGSNTMWYASIKLVPEEKSAVLVCVNSGHNEDAAELCHEVIKWLEE